MTRVLILGGGPDAERTISITSAAAVHRACLEADPVHGIDATLMIVDEPTVEDIKDWRAEVIFPVLHGQFGEGGVLQARLEHCGRPFVGSRSQASQRAMDKMGTKLLATEHSIPTPLAAIFEPVQSESPLGLPVVIKPIAEGSSVGLHICMDQSQWEQAHAKVCADIEKHPRRGYMIEQMILGRELTVSVLSNAQGALEALPIIEIAPAQGVYDYQAKYDRTDTVYTSNPEIADDEDAGMKAHALKICAAIGVRHLARVDFILDDAGRWFMLELNTMPGFTPSSLLPMAASAHGLDMPALCAHLVRRAIDTHPKTRTRAGANT